jgi:hypothetical protein
VYPGPGSLRQPARGIPPSAAGGARCP